MRIDLVVVNLYPDSAFFQRAHHLRSEILEMIHGRDWEITFLVAWLVAEVRSVLISDTARHYVGGILRHAHALCAFVAPTTNSYRRLVPGYEAPINIVYSQRNRSAAVRIPMYSPSEKSKRLEFRTPDPSCNPYYAFAAMLMAGLDGIANKTEPPPPIDKNLYDLPPQEATKVKSMPGSLDEALRALEEDHAFLLKGDVFTRDVIETWIAYKREKELDAIRLRPHPHEFALYFDI
jgi:glutamine synthetase